jgi:hypothetical protein
MWTPNLTTTKLDVPSLDSTSLSLHCSSFFLLRGGLVVYYYFPLLSLFSSILPNCLRPSRHKQTPLSISPRNSFFFFLFEAKTLFSGFPELALIST